jgi:hypothetical protein
VLVDAHQLVALHLALLAGVGTLPGFMPDVPEWAGDGYRPHVTAGAWGALRPSDPVTFDRIAVVDLGTADGRPRVAAVVSLSHAGRSLDDWPGPPPGGADRGQPRRAIRRAARRNSIS